MRLQMEISRIKPQVFVAVRKRIPTINAINREMPPD
jgi:hypothetical protein